MGKSRLCNPFENISNSWTISRLHCEVSPAYFLHSTLLNFGLWTAATRVAEAWGMLKFEGAAKTWGFTGKPQMGKGLFLLKCGFSAHRMIFGFFDTFCPHFASSFFLYCRGPMYRKRPGAAGWMGKPRMSDPSTPMWEVAPTNLIPTSSHPSLPPTTTGEGSGKFAVLWRVKKPNARKKCVGKSVIHL